EMLSELVENVDHKGSCIDDLLEVCPFAHEAECIFARLDQRPTAEALEAGLNAAVLRNELLLMARLNPEAHDIECCHFVLPAPKTQNCIDFLISASAAVGAKVLLCAHPRLGPEAALMTSELQALDLSLIRTYW